jgi:hypothetical protein
MVLPGIFIAGWHRGVRVKDKKPKAIPLEAILKYKGFDRIYKIEVRNGADERFVEALQDMVLANAHVGAAFKAGRKQGTVSPLRKAIAKALEANPGTTNDELWRIVASKPPRGYTAYDTPRLGRYFEGPTPDDEMKFPRFRNVASEERKRLKG